MQKEIPDILEDIQLAKACCEGNQHAQGRLYERYGPQMMSVCIRYGRNIEEAEDLFQEGFIKVFRKIGSYDGSGPLGAWIRRTMANNALDHLRKQQRELRQNLFYKDEYLNDHSDAFSAFDDDEELPTREQLMDFIAQMPHGYRTVFSMYAVEEYSHKEIADALGITESTSKTQYRKAKSYMRKLIENQFNKNDA